METSELANYTELEEQMDSNSVMLLREMHGAEDQARRARLFEQAADQEATLMSEVLDGAVITDFKFTSQEGKLYLLQPNGVTDWQRMHEQGVARAEAKAAENAGFRAYAEIAKGELEESKQQERMVRAGRPSAIVKLSLCGDDVMTADQLEQIGRHPEIQRAFLRVSVFDGRDMHIHSRSIDGMNLADGRGIADGWGTFDESKTELEPTASSIDVLSSRLYFEQSEMSIEQMHQLADQLVAAYDRLQQQRTGRVHKAGRAPEGVDTYKFVLQHSDLLRAHMDSLVELAARAELPIGHVAAVTNDLRYDIMSSYKQRLEGTWIEVGELGESVARAGYIERVLGTQFAGCDTVISAAAAEQAGYVNAQGSSRLERERMIKQLRKEVIGAGSCSACGAKGKLYGCGLCGACNKKWCDIFEETGKQTPVKKLAKYRPKAGALLRSTESFSEYWARLGREPESTKTG